ncbi:putative tyrosine/serine protein phosphatase [Aspergillus candidus]|uniref:Protein-tyrosine phosphatase-like protein n=1 Tax=Aspergillus candidus TaxID=41067 RepID=A0A2I2F6W5_ASPCN|nr:protein-tyrosine phosphatase-like protein [Aspergillus candidus]PLB36336.1 protein-tyrosine phosphatase-like protein [Aspergillus candidus]
MRASHPRQSSIDLDSPDRPFDNIINFRDVGRSVNQWLGRRVLKEGVLYRSARPDDASERDKRRLSEELHIATVIDLRSSTEHQMATDKRRAENDAQLEKEDPSVSSDAAAAATPDEHLVQLPGAQLHLVSLTGKAFERTLLWKLDWWNFFKVLSLAASGYRSDAITIVGEQVMSPRGLIGLGQDTLDSSTVEMRTLFHILASDTASSSSTPTSPSSTSPTPSTDGDCDRTQPRDESVYPLLIHCTQGKDRTGLIVLLCLLLVADVVPEDAMAADYVRSEPELVAEVDERMKEIRKLGLSEEYTKCPAGFIGEIKRHLQEVRRVREVLLA